MASESLGKLIVATQLGTHSPTWHIRRRANRMAKTNARIQTSLLDRPCHIVTDQEFRDENAAQGGSGGIGLRQTFPALDERAGERGEIVAVYLDKEGHPKWSVNFGGRVEEWYPTHLRLDP